MCSHDSFIEHFDDIVLDVAAVEETDKELVLDVHEMLGFGDHVQVGAVDTVVHRFFVHSRRPFRG